MYDADTSGQILGFLVFAVHMSTKPEHLREFFDKNADIITQLTDDDRETLRAEYRDAQEKLRKAA